MTPATSTSWRNIALAILAALIAAFQIGKAIIAAPLLQGDPLHLSLGQTGLVISALAIVGALLAMPLGVIIARFEARKILVGARVLEGIAVVMLLICASSIVGRQASLADRDLAMALSSTAVPSGIALVIFATTLFSSLGQPLSWPAIWQINAGLAIVCALVVLFGLPSMPAIASPHRHAIPSGNPRAGSAWNAIRDVGIARGPQFIAICFALYAIVYFAFSGFLPLLLRDLLGLTPIQAGFASAAIVASNVVGNIGAGMLMRRGVASRRIVSANFIIAALCIPALFWLHLPPVIAVSVAVAMIGCMGGIPGALTAIAPRVAPSPTLVAPTIGLMLQGSYAGQLIGPMSAGALAQAGGWTSVALMLLPLAVGGAMLARKL